MFFRHISSGWVSLIILGWFFLQGKVAMGSINLPADTVPPANTHPSAIIEPFSDTHPIASTNLTVNTDPPVLLTAANESAALVTIGAISFSGNKKTLPLTLERELFFAEGDTLTMAQLERYAELSRQNLIKTSLFNFVEVRIDPQDFQTVAVHFSFVERWYVWPIPILEFQDRNLNAFMENPSFSKLSYGVSLRMGNLGGRNEQLTLKLRAGYLQNYSLAFQTPYFNRRQNVAVAIEAGMDMSRESAYITFRNNQLFYKDNDPVFRKQYGFFSLFLRPGMFSRHRFFVGFDLYSYADTLQQLNPRFMPGNKNTFSYITLGYEYALDRRDVRAYPLNGHHVFASVKRHGIMGMLEDERIDVMIYKGSARLYRELAQNWYFASGLGFKWSDGSTLAYYNQKGLGFETDMVRGYEDYVIDAQGYAVAKANVKYALFPNKVTQLAFIPTETFSRIHYALYMGVFVDVGYAYDKYFYHDNSLNNAFLAGAGVGLDFVTYYDKVFRAELTINRRGEGGVYFHIVAPI